MGLPIGEGGDDVPTLIAMLRMLESMVGAPEYPTRPIGCDETEKTAEVT